MNVIKIDRDKFWEELNSPGIRITWGKKWLEDLLDRHTLSDASEACEHDYKARIDSVHKWCIKCGQGEIQICTHKNLSEFKGSSYRTCEDCNQTLKQEKPVKECACNCHIGRPNKFVKCDHCNPRKQDSPKKEACLVCKAPGPHHTSICSAGRCACVCSHLGACEGKFDSTGKEPTLELPLQHKDWCLIRQFAPCIRQFALCNCVIKESHG